MFSLLSMETDALLLRNSSPSPKEFLSVILEAEMLIKNIRQDNVIRYYGLHVAGCIGGKVHYLLALGHCTGGNLLEWAIQSRFRQNFEHRKIGRILRDVLQGLDYLHQHDLQLIHCDIKPQNLVFHMPEGRIVIIDFEGVAVGRQLKSEKVTNAYTPSYAAPELLRVLGDIDDNQGRNFRKD
ncbi:serine/threonine-protein kinase 17A-like [Paramacrobiotus metropolitanus]|uniref:serine/threonine-protein kinase 17A-like n=1 Tax=Paramacrobiotus metropolitanus TaxID=2943436 RepID=UPI0024463A90|nr:serine/threonine-protein kinase 17A-like [Paramacrobiotus metropolitanus]XP_055353015.1 serine/threonine-protein kinase 17A-like [Paramacrobiotus metropolitanus]